MSRMALHGSEVAQKIPLRSRKLQPSNYTRGTFKRSSVSQERMAASPSHYENLEDKSESNIALEEMRNFHVNGHDTVSQVNLENLDNLVPPVVVQPQVFTASMLDPLSRGVHSQLIKHMSYETVNAVVQQGGNQLQTAVNGQFVSLRGNMSYNELLVGLMYEGENFQGHNQFSHLLYTHLVFADENNVTMSQRTGGICLITNQRLLMLSSQLEKTMAFTQWGDPKRLPGGYNLTAVCGDSTYYQPIPLRCLKSIEMGGNTGVTGEIAVHGIAPCCGGLCGLCGLMCCPGSNALKTWHALPMTRSQRNEMVVTLGVLMPPWEKRMYLHIHVNQNVPVAVVRDFMSLLQKNAPGIK